MCGLFQPICQVRFTNVATVRLKVHGERFEIACYKNKVVNWRSGVETDIQEVLQSPYIFTSLSKGKLANNVQLMKAFNTTDINKITKQILDKGEFQISKEERNQILDSTFRDIVSILHEVTVNPNTGHPLTRTLLENALKSSGFSVSLNEPPKKQALKALTLLQKRYPESIARCKMRLQVNFVTQQYEQIAEFFRDKDITIEQNTTTGSNSSSAAGTPSKMDSSWKDRGDGAKSEGRGSQKDKNRKAAREGREGEKMEFMLIICAPSLYREIEHFVLNKLDPPGTVQLITLNIKDSNNAAISTPSRTKNEVEEEDELLLSQVDSMKVSRPEISQAPPEEGPLKEVVETLEVKPVTEKEVNKRRCLNCNLEFDDNTFYRKHFKSDFHVFNSKRKLQGLEPITEQEYDHLQANLL